METKLFITTSNDGINLDELINNYIIEHKIDLVDIKFSSHYDKGNHRNYFSALLIYKI